MFARKKLGGNMKLSNHINQDYKGKHWVLELEPGDVVDIRTRKQAVEIGCDLFEKMTIGDLWNEQEVALLPSTQKFIESLTDEQVKVLEQGYYKLGVNTYRCKGCGKMLITKAAIIHKQYKRCNPKRKLKS
jgi:hypothetical protein